MAQVGSSDLKAYEYLYEVDGAVAEVLVSGQSTWKYDTDANGNIIRVGHYGNARTIVVNSRDQVCAIFPWYSMFFLNR